MVNWAKREADHSPPFISEIKMRGAIPPLPITYSWVLNYA